jgi:hypothetical protein
MPAVTVLAASSTEIVPEDYARTLVVVANADASANIHIAFGVAATTNDAYIAPGGNMTIDEPRCKCAINGISSSGNITAKYSKLSLGT